MSDSAHPVRVETVAPLGKTRSAAFSAGWDALRERLAALVARSYVPILIAITAISWGAVALPMLLYA